MAASSKNTTEVDAEESHEWVWADKAGLVGGWVSRMARSKLSLSFVSDVQLSSGSVGIKVQEQQTGNPVYLLKGRLEKPDMKADIFGFGSGKVVGRGAREAFREPHLNFATISSQAVTFTPL